MMKTIAMMKVYRNMITYDYVAEKLTNKCRMGVNFFEIISLLSLFPVGVKVP